jgi:hypothetical protein
MHSQPGQPKDLLFNETTGGFPEWIKARKHRTLPEIQLEVMEWTLAGEEKIGVAEEGDEEAYLAPLRRKVEELRSAVAAARL